MKRQVTIGNKKGDYNMNKEDIESLIYGFGNDSYTRIEKFIDVAHKLRGGNYWYGLRIAYVCSDNLFSKRDFIKILFSQRKVHKEMLMSKLEQQYYKNLPEEIIIYRGMTLLEYESKNFGISWTLKKSIANFFAHKYKRNHDTNHLKKMVYSLTIKKKNAIAFLNARKEFEIIYIHNEKKRL